MCRSPSKSSVSTAAPVNVPVITCGGHSGATGLPIDWNNAAALVAPGIAYLRSCGAGGAAISSGHQSPAISPRPPTRSLVVRPAPAPGLRRLRRPGAGIFAGTGLGRLRGGIRRRGGFLDHERKPAHTHIHTSRVFVRLEHVARVAVRAAHRDAEVSDALHLHRLAAGLLELLDNHVIALLRPRG